MSELRSLYNSVKRNRSHQAQRRTGGPIVWAYMGYICRDCKFPVDMYIENTLERHNGESHKPVPFAIRCPQCGGFHCYGSTGLIPLRAERPAEMYENYFKDYPDQDCGIAVIRGDLFGRDK